MLTLALMFALLQAATPEPEDPTNVIISVGAPKDWVLEADPQSPDWIGIPGVRASKSFFGEAVSLPPTEIRSRWTKKNLYLLFICPYERLNLKPNPVTTEETGRLWNWDVAEAFIGSDYLRISRYKEFQVSPQGEYVDLDIDQDDPKSEQKAVEWQSGFTVRGRIDPQKKIWYGEMCIPFQSLDIKAPKAGDELRIGLYRIEGPEPNRTYIAWRPTGAKTFHIPTAFGSLVLK
ncbi:MAG: carbohydrate-binding family 9-like protein [Terriglobia bacterium]